MFSPTESSWTTQQNQTARTSSGPVSVVTVVPRAGEEPAASVSRLAGELRRNEGAVLMVMIYGSVAVHDSVLEQLRQETGLLDWPLLWVEGASCFDGALAGFQVFVLPSGKIERVRLGERTIGSVYHDGGARHCLLAGLTPLDVSLPRAQQCEQFFESAEEALAQAGFTYGDIARTWFYNDDILAWYDDFNHVRTAFYAKKKFRSGSIPASTAVRGRNPAGAALTFGAWAVVPERADAKVFEVASPLQCPAPAYGSSFSRATEIATDGSRRLLVSGTASIEPGGRTVWQGDIVKQIALTMEVVEAILKPRSMGYGDVVRATAYFKYAADVVVFEKWLGEHDLQSMPVLSVHCDICRDDLLFEIELDACVAGEV